MKISIVVPVYNVEAYIDECIASIVANEQVIEEIILVDDGSKDSSGTKCDLWEKKSNKIRVFHKKNGGLMSAWKYGVEHCSGDYVGFVDSDDWIEKGMYAKMRQISENYNPDIITSGLIKEYCNGTTETELIYFKEGYYDRHYIESSIYPVLIYNTSIQGRSISPNRVTKLYKKKILEQAIPYCNDLITIGEDLLTTFAAIVHSNSIYICNDFYPYHYRINDASMIRSYNKDKYSKIKFLYHCMCEVNNKSTYDFSQQISTDYLDLFYRQMECEILQSGVNAKQLVSSLKGLVSDELYIKVLAASDISQVKVKNKLYANLLKFHLYYILIIIRKIL